MIFFRLGLNFKAAKIFVLVLPFQTTSVLNKRSSLKSILTVNGTHSGKVPYTKVVDNFIFPERINTFLYNKWFRSNDLWKSGGAAGIFSFQDIWA
jgi:hypothetical protein